MAGGILVQATGTTPAAPSAGSVATYVDSADLRLKSIDAGGVVSIASQVLKASLLINGGFTFAQRQTPNTLTTYSNLTGRSYTADRWGVTNENASVQFRRVDTIATPETGLTARYFGRYVKTTNAGKFVLSQVLEGTDTAPLRGRVVRLQVRMKYSVNPITVRLGLGYLTSAGAVDTIPATFISAFGAAGTDPTLGANLAYITPTLTEATGTISGSGVTCVLSTAWARYSATFTVPASALNLVALLWTNGLPAALDDILISEASLTDGPNIVEWAPPDVGTEVSKVSRFFAKSFPIDVGPAQNLGVNTGEFRFTTPVALGAIIRSNSFAYPVRMRGAPTVTLYSPGAASAQAYDETAPAPCTATATAGITDLSLGITTLGDVALTAVGNTIGVHLALDAEL